MSTNNINILRATSMSQGNYNNTVGENKAEFYQDLVDERFDYATDYMQIQEQFENGSDVYNNIYVRVTHAINTTISENFGNEIKKIIFKDYNHPQNLGKMYKFDGATWITVNLDVRTKASNHSLVRKCNNMLKWVNPNNKSEVFEYPCVFTKEFKSTSFDEGSQGVIQISGDFMIIVQQNELTKTISFNQRFVLDGKSFQVTQINNHLSKTYMTLKIKELSKQANDDTIENIANATNLTPIGTEIKILPQTILIREQKTEQYTVYKYINGIANSDGFTISASQAPQASYVLNVIGSNRFSIRNLNATPIPLILSCTDNVTGEVKTMQIQLGGKW